MASRAAIALPRIDLSLRQMAVIGLFAAVAVVLFWPTFRWMAERFDAADSFYSHGWLIPFASGWLAWQRRETVQSMPRRGSYWGLLLLVPTLLLYVVSTWWQIGFLGGFTMILAIYGFVWTMWGWDVCWAMRFPLLFLLFMVPLPGIVLISISFKMKMMAASLAASVLNFCGMPTVQAGSRLTVPGVSVIVDDTCSGLRSLISLIALSTMWISMLPTGAPKWQKLLIVGASIPIALAANMVRILVLVLLSAIYGAQIAESFIHYGSGIVVFGIAIAVLAGLSRWLQKLSPSYSLGR